MAIQTQMSIDTKALADALRKIPAGGSVSYSALGAEVRRDVTKEARHSLDSARRILLREGIRFDVVRGEGLVRMTDSEIARSGSRSMRLVSRRARQEAKKVAAVGNFAALTDEEKIQHNTTLSILGAVAHFTKPQQVKILEAAVSQAKQQLPVRDAVESIQRALSGKK